jgi:lycopene beta-cyclase
MTYDYLFTGTGAAAFSLLLRMLDHPAFQHHTFLLIDRDDKRRNDRTWCFWEQGKGYFESIVHRQWDHVWFHGPSFSKDFALAPYRYKMIRGLDFYNHALERVSKDPRVTRVQAQVERTGQDKDYAWVETEVGRFTAQYLFNSIASLPDPAASKGYHLLQHFKGWVVKTAQPVFDPNAPVMMDFRVSQEHGTTFAYILPLDQQRALIEYTLFTGKLLSDHQYDEGLKSYLRDFLQVNVYEIEEEEFGIIPMTNHRFSRGAGRMVNIGTAGGHTKASSGYTFMFIQRHSEKMMAALVKGESPILPAQAQHPRFMFYDTVLLHILEEQQISGARVFETLFRKNGIQQVFKFLDNASSLPEDLRLISSLPTWHFARAAVLSKMRGSGDF